MTTDKMTQYLEQMAAQLGVAAEHVYGVLVAQAYAQGIRDIIIGGSITLFMVVAILYGLFVLWKACQAEDFDFGEVVLDHPGATIWSIVALIGAGVILAIFATTFADGILMVMNPEYYAIREIMEVLAR